MSQLVFTLETDLTSKIFYCSMGDSQCVQNKEISANFTSDRPGHGSVETRGGDGDSCTFKDSHTHIYLWSDPAHENKLVQIKVFEKNGTGIWTPEVEYVNGLLTVEIKENGTNNYSFTVG